MKKLYTIVAILFVYLIVSGFHAPEEKNFKNIMKDYRHEKGFMMISMPAFMVRPFIPAEEKLARQLMQHIKMFRVLINESIVDHSVTNNLASDVKSYFEHSDYNDFVEIISDTEHVLIKGKVFGTTITEVIVFVNTPEEAVIIQVTGEIHLDELTETSRMIAEKF